MSAVPGCSCRQAPVMTLFNPGLSLNLGAFGAPHQYSLAIFTYRPAISRVLKRHLTHAVAAGWVLPHVLQQLRQPAVDVISGGDSIGVWQKPRCHRAIHLHGVQAGARCGERAVTARVPLLPRPSGLTHGPLPVAAALAAPVPPAAAHLVADVSVALQEERGQEESHKAQKGYQPRIVGVPELEPLVPTAQWGLW